MLERFGRCPEVIEQEPAQDYYQLGHNRMAKVSSAKVLATVVILVSIAALYAVSGPDFMPFMRYRSVPEWSAEDTLYRIEIVHAVDSTYRLIVYVSKASKRTLITWFGDSIKAIRYHDALLRLNSPGDLFGFDSSMIRISGDQIIPRRAGIVPLLVKLPNRVDRLTLRVESEEWGLAVYRESRPR